MSGVCGRDAGRGDYHLLSPFGGTGCDDEKAQAYLELMPDFIDDAIGLYQTMSGETWG